MSCKTANKIKINYEFANITNLIKELDIFKTEYKIIEEIRVTNTKGVYVATKNNKKYFVKAKLKDFMSDNDLEVYKLLKKNPHPNVNVIDAIYVTKNFILIFAEFLEGCDMSVKEFRKCYENNLPEIFKNTLYGLSHINTSGIIHCDMKLENIMIVPKQINNAIQYTPVIVDFDCSRLINDCKVNKCIGTIGSIAPEISSGIVSPKSDLWEIGMAFFYFIFGTTDTVTDESSDDEEKIVLPKTELMNNYTGKYKKIITLIKPMLNVNQDNRPEISRILCHC